MDLKALINVLMRIYERLGKQTISSRKRKLSGSTDGLQIKVAATTTPGTLIHTAVSNKVENIFDQITLYAINTSASAVKLTIEWGTTTAPDGNIEVTIPAESGYTLVVPGLILQNGMIVRAFAGTANVLMINGFIERLD